MDNNQQLVTRSVDLMAPANRFASSSRLYNRLHRWQLLLKKYWWVGGLVFVSVLVPAYIYSIEAPPAYQSKARLWLTGRLNINEGRLYTEELIDYLATQSELLSSPTVQQRALAKLRAQFSNEVWAASSRKSGLQLIPKAKEFIKTMLGMDASNTNTAEAFPFTLKVTESSKSSILELRATGTEPASTRAFLNALIEEYFAFKKESRSKASDRTLASITTEIHQLSEALKAQQDKLHEFQSSNNVVFLQEQGNSAGSYLAQLNRQIATLRTQLQLLEMMGPDQWIENENRRANPESGETSEASAREVLSRLAGPQGDLFRANQQMQLLRAKREELSHFLRPEHPKMIKLNEEIATQEKLVQISKEEALRQLTAKRQALQLELKNLESVFQEWDVKAIQASRKMADYDGMRQQAQRLQAAYDRMLGLVQTVDVGKTVDQENVGVLEAASVGRPRPRLMLNMGVAFFVALVLSFGLLYCLALFDDRFASVFDLANHFSEEVLGQIPAISLKNPKGQLSPQFLERQRFEFLESFRNLRSSLLYMQHEGKRPKTILITSSVPKEGKSTVTLYLAATMALGNSRVLLIDGDMRRASLHKFFAVKYRPGLAEMLSHEVSPAGAIVATSMDNLSLLPAGAARKNPGELLLSGEWNRFLAEISAQYDYILIDSPPLLATDDAATIAPKVDGVIVIVRGSFTSARMVQRAVDVLRQRQAYILGLVFNRALSSAYHYDYYQRYEKAYRWEPEAGVRRPELVASTVEKNWKSL